MKFLKLKNYLSIDNAPHSFTSGGIKLNVYLCECVYIYVKYTQIHMKKILSYFSFNS